MTDGDSKCYAKHHNDQFYRFDVSASRLPSRQPTQSVLKEEGKQKSRFSDYQPFYASFRSSIGEYLAYMHACAKCQPIVNLRNFWIVRKSAVGSQVRLPVSSSTAIFATAEVDDAADVGAPGSAHEVTARATAAGGG